MLRMCLHIIITLQCYEGFLPMCTEVAPSLFVLLPKLHEQRCVLFFDNLHQPKQAKKRSKHYKLTSNKAFGAVMQGCIDQHGEAWLYAPMRQIFKALLMHQHQPSQPNANPSAGPTEAEPLVAGVRIQVACPESPNTHPDIKPCRPAQSEP